MDFYALPLCWSFYSGKIIYFGMLLVEHNMCGNDFIFILALFLPVVGVPAIPHYYDCRSTYHGQSQWYD